MNSMDKNKEVEDWLNQWSEHIRHWEQEVGRLRVSERGKVENWLDRHHHFMAALRTIMSITAAATGVLIFCKVFGLV